MLGSPESSGYPAFPKRVSQLPEVEELIKGISFLGIRTGSLAKMREFCVSILELPVLHDRRDFIAFRAPNGDRIELFGVNELNHSHFTTGPVCGFEVADIVAARQKLEARGIELLSGIEGKPNGTQWIHFRGPDGNVYEFVHHADID